MCCSGSNLAIYFYSSGKKEEHCIRICYKLICFFVLNYNNEIITTINKKLKV